MKKLTLLLGLLFVVSFAFSQNNLSEVYQDGAFNIATVKQIGVDNEAYLSMLGDYNTIWQCQTGHGNDEWFVIHNGDFNSTFQGKYWIPWHYTQFGVCKFFVCQLWDPSNTQHQFGHFNKANVYIEKSDFNKVSQTQGWKYHPFLNTPGPVVGNANQADITIKYWSDYNKVMQAQLLDNNTASAEIICKSDDNTILQYQFGFDNESEVEIMTKSDFNKVGIVQGTAWYLSFYNRNFVGIYNCSDYNEVIVNQFDHSNFAEVIIEDYSDWNKVAIHQENPWCCSWGSDAYVHIFENADFNEMSICQWDGGGHDADIIIKQGDYNKIYDGVFFGVPQVFWHPEWGPKVYTEIFWDDMEFNVIRQEGYKNTAEILIKQFGTGADEQADRNLVSIYQYGEWSSYNVASMWIFNSSDNRAAIAQEGYMNTAWLDIVWNSNFNIAGISQHTDNQFAYIRIADGSDFNQANIVQGDSWYNDGFNDAYIFMTNHDYGFALINQFWAHNLAEITQINGEGNWATIFQKSYASEAYIYETGDYNFASICQHHYGYHFADIYIDGVYNGFNNAIEMTSPYFKPSNPGYHCGYIFKVENWVCFDPTNMIRQEGKGQYATMEIFGYGNRSNIYQKGYKWPLYSYNNEAMLYISGDCNITAQYQNGLDNYSTITIDNANCGKALTYQVGEYNTAGILQYDGCGNMAGVDQFGTWNAGYVVQTGCMNEATINQFDWNPHGN